MLYFDTSFVTPYYVNEASSEAVATFMQSVPAGQLAVSDWTHVEFASQLARRVRMDEFTHSFAQSVMVVFEQDVSESFHTLEPDRRDFVVASKLLLLDPALGLRGPDALHLALARKHEAEVYSLDTTLIHAALALGIPATDANILGEI